MKSITKAGSRWRAFMVLTPLVLLVILAIAASGSISAGSAEYVYDHSAPGSVYGISDQMLYVANGRASDVKVIDVGTMTIVDTIPVPNEVTPDGYHGLNPGLMNWEVHGVVPSQDRTHIYAVGALSGGSYNRNPDGSIDTSSSAGDPIFGTPGFRLADYRMYDINVATKATEREIPMGGGGTVNPVGYCGLEYNLNDESSNEIIGASMNASNATLLGALGVDLAFARGTGTSEMGGWAFENVSAGTATGFMTTAFDGGGGSNPVESSTCSVAWNAAGDRGFAAQMFQPLVDKVDWTTRTVDGEIAASTVPGTSYHQATSDKVNGLLYVASSSGNVDVFDMTTNMLVGSINVRSLTGTSTNDVHGVEFNDASGHGILYVTSRSTPDSGGNMELVLHVDSPSDVTLIGSVTGLADSACGVYAINDKSEYYGTKPSLTLSKTHIYWASFGDYTARKLSVDYSIGNSGTAGAANVTVVGSTSTAGVTSATAMPASAGNIASGGGSVSTTLQYNIPTGTSVFSTKTYATAQNGASVFTYPGPYPGA